MPYIIQSSVMPCQTFPLQSKMWLNMTKKKMIGRLQRGSLNSGIFIKRRGEIAEMSNAGLCDHGIDLVIAEGRDMTTGRTRQGKKSRESKLKY